jgi:asparagine synthase (glutamine-hydrolysing)
MFCVVIAQASFTIDIDNKVNPDYRIQQKDSRYLSVFYSFKQKPINDSFFASDIEGCTLFEGVLVSGNNLSSGDTRADITKVLKQDNRSDLATFHGQFACLNYHQPSEELRIYTNLSNNFRVYYYSQGKLFIAASSIRLITQQLKANNVSFSLDEIGVRMILSYGYMLRNWTNISEIRQLGSAHCLCASATGTTCQPYFRYDTAIKHRNRQGCPIELTKLFSTAVKDAFARDAVQKHFAFISGGLDSRLVVWTAHELGYKQVDCLNFSQPGYLDQTIAMQLTRALGYKFSFFSLEGGEYLKKLDDNLVYHEGQIVLHGAAHLFAAINTQKLEQYGIMHSGQIGDVIKGSYLQARGHTPVNLMAGAYSTRLIPTIQNDLQKYTTDYPTHELFILENRGFNCVTNGDLACLHDSYSVSPFVQPDFMQLSLSIDPALRAGARMYIHWMQKSYPQASKYKWEKFNSPVSTPYYLARLQYNLWRGSDKIMRRFTHKPNTLNMNPFDYWWATNPSLKQHFLPQFRVPESVSAHISPELTKDINLLFAQGNLGEKFQAYTAVKSITYLLDLS